MKLNFELILNVWVAIIFYNLVLKSFATVLMRHFLDNSKYVQEQKKTFREKLKEKLEETKNND